MVRFAEAIEQARVDVVPRILIGGGPSGTGDAQGNLLEALTGVTLSERLGPDASDARPRDPQAEALRQQIRDAVTMCPVGNGTTSRA